MQSDNNFQQKLPTRRGYDQTRIQRQQGQVADLDVMVGLKTVKLVQKFQHGSLDLAVASFLTVEPLGS